jgi:type III pantothenate kinase
MLTQRLLAIDIGNTRLKWALFVGEAIEAQEHCELEAIESLYARWQTLPAPTAIIGCNVAGDNVRRRAKAALAQWPEVPQHWLVASAEQCGVRNSYDFPELLGADRWAGVIAARQLVPDAACLLITVGTAVTVDALDRTGVFLGGLILPGFGLLLTALESGTAGLRVSPGEFQAFPSNTSNALMTGGIQALAGAAERQLGELVRRCGSVQVILAGGAASKLAPHLSFTYALHDNLVLEGLRFIAMHDSAVAKNLQLHK